MKWLFGQLNKPREEDRIFMFVDMKDSTRIAEKLEHKRFSNLVQDVFNDMWIIDSYQGDLYQYLGDGAIFSWSNKKGTQNNNCINAFFAFQRQIEKRSKYYNRKYGFVPGFKAGMHAGKIMVLQVGKFRRRISYNGDTINTTARIESMCNEYKQDLLISVDLEVRLKKKKHFRTKEIGNIKLRGKRKSVNLYKVHKI
jgi:adenylate cyclase